MSPKQRTHISKFLSLVLRHEPERIGLTIDASGWASVDHLLERCNAAGTKISLEELCEVVSTSEKKRFAFSEDQTRIRANQGHTVSVDLGYAPATPPEILYHGTAEQFMASIRLAGLLKGQRHHVHLSGSAQTARTVGERRGRGIVLTVRSGEMCRQGMLFLVSENDVWLTDHVPPLYIDESGGHHWNAKPDSQRLGLRRIPQRSGFDRQTFCQLLDRSEFLETVLRSNRLFGI